MTWRQDTYLGISPLRGCREHESIPFLPSYRPKTRQPKSCQRLVSFPVRCGYWFVSHDRSQVLSNVQRPMSTSISVIDSRVIHKVLRFSLVRPRDLWGGLDDSKQSAGKSESRKTVSTNSVGTMEAFILYLFIYFQPNAILLLIK